MDFKTTLENIATAKGWKFQYARRDFQNLWDASGFVADTIEGYGNDETVMFVDPIKRGENDDGTNYTGSFFVLTRSNHDKKYKDRTTLFIDPLIAELKSIRQGLKCNYDITTWASTEVINVFDLNADGLLINYQVKSYE